MYSWCSAFMLKRFLYNHDFCYRMHIKLMHALQHVRCMWFETNVFFLS